jgi:hypothetical protein
MKMDNFAKKTAGDWHSETACTTSSSGITTGPKARTCQAHRPLTRIVATFTSIEVVTTEDHDQKKRKEVRVTLGEISTYTPRTKII